MFKNLNVHNMLLSFPVVLVIILSVIITQGVAANLMVEWWMILITTLVAAGLVVTAVIIWRQPQNGTKAAFMVTHFGLGKKQLLTFSAAII